MADEIKAPEKGAKVKPVNLTKEQKLSYYKKVEIPIAGSKEKIVNYDEQDIEIVALEGCKHMKADETYTVGSSTAIILVERGWAKKA